MEEETRNTCLQDGAYPWPANEVFDRLTPLEIENIQANTGVDGTQTDNCGDLTSAICAIKQEVDAVTGDDVRVIAPNEQSKCQDSEDPTLASMWSRILRFADMASAIMCAYDPFVATLLKQGHYPQILMGAAQEGGYPQWVTPDESPELDSKRPVTSDGIIKAINDALLGVWHPWKEHPTFTYFAQTLGTSSDLNNLSVQTTKYPPANGDTALVANDGTRTSALYTYNGSSWVFTKQLTETADNLTNFSVTNILKGYYATKDIYYFDDGTNGTWQVMDTDISALEARVDQLTQIFNTSVLSPSASEQYLLTTRANYTAAMAVGCTSGKTTLTFITG